MKDSKTIETARIYIDKKNISNLPDESGVYFLYQKSILVYIGKAKSFKTRVPQHDMNKEFNRIGYEITHYSRARTLEKELLAIYKQEHSQLPYYNRQS
jgi:excinuclease UvrABC nuclease subunit